MKKNNGGYVLAYVMIVITVVSAMALAVGSVAVRNLQVQEAAVERMQDLYAAEGEIERFQAWVIGKTIEEINNTYPDPVNPPANPNVTVEVTVESTGDPATITVTATANGTTVTAGMTVTFDNSGEKKVTEIKYTSYNITATQ